MSDLLPKADMCSTFLNVCYGPPHPHGEGLAVGFVAELVPCPLTLFAMYQFVSITTRQGISIGKLTRALDAVAGALLIVISLGELLR